MNLGRVLKEFFSGLTGVTYFGRAERSQELHNQADAISKQNGFNVTEEMASMKQFEKAPLRNIQQGKR